MHELGIAGSILESAQMAMKDHAGARLNTIGVRIGVWSGLDPESLRFCFGALARDTSAASAELSVEICPLEWRCRACQKQFVPADGTPECPQCGSCDCRLISGQQLEIAYLDLEEA